MDKREREGERGRPREGGKEPWGEAGQVTLCSSCSSSCSSSSFFLFFFFSSHVLFFLHSSWTAATTESLTGLFFFVRCCVGFVVVVVLFFVLRVFFFCLARVFSLAANVDVYAYRIGRGYAARPELRSGSMSRH